MWQLYRQVPVPTLLVRGSESDVLTQDTAERAAREMQRCRLVLVSGAGHSVPGDNPDDFTAAVDQFLDDVAAGRFDRPEDDEPPPLIELVEAQDDASRRRPGMMTLVAIGVGATLAIAAIFGATRTAKKRKTRRQRAEEARRAAEAQAARRIAGVPVPAIHSPSSADLERTRQRAIDLLGELSVVGRDGVARARTAVANVDIDQARDTASDLAHQLSEQARHAPSNVRSAVSHVDRKELKGKGKDAAKRGRSAAGMAMVAARKAPALLSGKKPAKKKRRFGWRS